MDIKQKEEIFALYAINQSRKRKVVASDNTLASFLRIAKKDINWSIKTTIGTAIAHKVGSTTIASNLCW